MHGHVELAEGTLFAGEFRIVRKLAAGGMGAVYVAEQLSTGRQRALKLMHVGMASSSELRDKFTLEARVGARIASEHVVEVLGAGVDPTSETPWLAMELLTGEDLMTTVEQHGPFALPEAVAILGQVCHALAAAHAAGIVHRDLKPENVFLAESKRAQESYTVKVLDFGIAKVLEEARATSTGAIGSPLWMAPEQSERSGLISPATDVWALGLVAFHMITAKSFWLAAATGAAGDVSVRHFFRELVLDPIPAASERASELGLEVAIPPGFDVWFAQAVTREPLDRYPDAAEAYAALCELCGFGAPLPVDAKRPSLAEGRTRTEPRSSSPISSTASDRLARAQTVAHTRNEPPPPSLDLGAARLPISGPSPRLVVGVGVLVALTFGVAYSRLRTPAANLGAADAGAGVVALPFCPKGMVRIPGGEPTLGSDAGPNEEQPAHVEKVGAFCMDTTEVSVAEYRKCARAQPSGCPGDHTKVDWPGITKEERDAWSPYCNERREGYGEHPMNCVSFEDAVAYCRWMGKKLPTEAQWELVARGLEGRPFPWGHDAPTPLRVNACDEGCAKLARHSVDTVAASLVGDDRWDSTSPTGAFPEGVGPFGHFDLAGNVAEWVDAPFCNYGESACGTAARVVRGGSWMSQSATALRGSARAKVSPAARQPDVGFRCVK